MREAGTMKITEIAARLRKTAANKSSNTTKQHSAMACVRLCYRSTHLKLALYSQCCEEHADAL